MFKNLKVGDKVWVQHQEGRYSATKEGEYITVEKLGRKYGYLAKGFGDKAFCLKTGQSHHPSFGNVRANGWGFDVYPTQEDYLNAMHAKDEFIRLQKRLTKGNWRVIVDLPPQAVNEIHAVLDKYGIE